MSLLACPSCTRHVRRSESLCPFCKGVLSFEPAPERAAPRARLGRAATFAFGAALSTNVVGCSTPSTTDTGPTPADAGPADTFGELDTGGIGPLYGGAPDTGPAADAGTEEDTGGIGPLYGGAPDTGVGNDAGTDAGGGIGPLYGAPPA